MNLSFEKICCNIYKHRSLNLKRMMKKGNELLKEELDIIKIMKTIRKFNKDKKSKFIIDFEENEQDIT